MADYTVVGDVSTIIVQTLTDAFADLQPVAPEVELNDLSDTVQTPPAKLTVFLYDICEDPASRNRPPVRSMPPDAPTVRKPPMALLLRYLLTPWGGTQVTQQEMLGRTLQALYEDAILDGGQLSGSLAGSTDALRFTLTPLSLEQKSWVWYAIQKSVPAVPELRGPGREPGRGQGRPGGPGDQPRPGARGAPRPAAAPGAGAVTTAGGREILAGEQRTVTSPAWLIPVDDFRRVRSPMASPPPWTAGTGTPGSPPMSSRCVPPAA